MSDNDENKPNTIILKELNSTDEVEETNQSSIFIRLRTDAIYRGKLYQTFSLLWLNACLVSVKIKENNEITLLHYLHYYE